MKKYFDFAVLFTAPFFVFAAIFAIFQYPSIVHGLHLLFIWGFMLSSLILLFVLFTIICWYHASGQYAKDKKQRQEIERLLHKNIFEDY